MPALLAEGRRRQRQGSLSQSLRFADTPSEAGSVDLLLASGLLQYLDISFETLVQQIVQPPRWILLNKVAMRDGDEVVTLEQIGPSRVPYRIRSKEGFEGELARTGYEVADSWDIPSLSHRIGTHPWLGHSRSRGYLLTRR